MTSCYGSRKEPKKYFSGHKLAAFHKACRQVAPGAFGMLNILRNTWNPKAYRHEWILPDGYQAYIPVTVIDIIEVNIEELNNFPMNTLVVQNMPKLKSVANIANITHSIDGYVLRSLLRYCNYDKQHVQYISNLIEATILERSLDNSKEPKECSIKPKIERLNLLDISYINTIDTESIKNISTDVLKLLMQDVNKMLEHEPFDIIPVHDCFACSPLHMNTLRMWYNEILARLSNSNLLEDIIEQLLGEKTELTVFSEDISESIRNSDYAIN